MPMTLPSNPTIDLMHNHVSVRSFSGEPVSDEMVEAVVEAARRSPTSSNWQTYSVIVIRDAERKRRLAQLAGGQDHVAESQVFLAFAADIRRLSQAGSLHGETPAGGLNQAMVSIVDATIVGQSAQIAAESFGLGAVMVGGLRRDPQGVADELGLPEGVFVVFGMSIGWPAGDPLAPGLKPRLPAELVVHHEQYSDDDADELIERYDEELKAFYERRGRNLADAAWSAPVATRSAVRSYTDLAPFLLKQGFTLD